MRTTTKEPLAYKLVRACEWMAIHDIERIDREPHSAAMRRAQEQAHAEWYKGHVERRRQQARTAWRPAPIGRR